MRFDSYLRYSRRMEPPDHPPPPARPVPAESASTPGGLLGLLVMPIQLVVTAGLGIFSNLVSGILGALFGGLLGRAPETDEPDPPGHDDE